MFWKSCHVPLSFISSYQSSRITYNSCVSVWCRDYNYQWSPAMLPCHMPGSETTRLSESATRKLTMSPARSHLKTGILQPSTSSNHWLLMRHLVKRPWFRTRAKSPVRQGLLYLHVRDDPCFVTALPMAEDSRGLALPVAIPRNPTFFSEFTNNVNVNMCSRNCSPHHPRASTAKPKVKRHSPCTTYPHETDSLIRFRGN